MPEFKVTPQDTITFLQEYIDGINDQIDEMLEGHNIKREIMALQLRIKVLKRAPGNPFTEKIKELEKELKACDENYVILNPQIESLEAERHYYRELLNEVSS